MSMKQYSNTFSNFTVTKTVTENTKWDSKKEKHIKLAKPKVTKELIFAPRNLWDFADFVRACDVVSDGKGPGLNSSHAYVSYAVFCVKKKMSGHTNNLP